MRAQRAVWGDTLTELAATDESIVVVDGDLATSTTAVTFADAYPDRFVQAGIAEQNMIGIAFGMSTLGYRPWCATFGVFLTNRAIDQIRMLVSQTKAPVRLAAHYTGLLNGSAGKTHQDLADLSVMRAMPNFTVLAPADEVEAEAVVRWAAGHDGPVYVRFAREPVADVFGEDYEFVLGRPVQLREGADAVVVSTGVQTSRTAQAVAALDADGISVRHVHLPTIKPLDEEALWQLLSGANLVISVEEHTVCGGLGDVVAGVLTEHASAARQARIGLADTWSESAPSDFLLDKYGLSPDRVAQRIRSELGVRV